MNYELARRLKEEGFPIKEIPIWKRVQDNIDGKEPIDYQYILPTLSELIEACGDGFLGLWVSHNEETKGKWYIVPNGQILSLNEHPKQCYSTPEEAVAELYLSLHRKI